MFRKILISFILLHVPGLVWSAIPQTRKSPVTKGTTLKRIAEAPDHEVRIVEHASGSLIVEWDCPPITVDRDQETGEVSAIWMDGVMSIIEPGVPEIPRVSQFMDCLPGKVSVQVLESEFETLNLGPMAPQPEDYIIDPRPTGDGGTLAGDDPNDPLRGMSRRERIQATPRKAGLWPEQSVQITEGGVFRGHRLVTLTINPVQVDATTGDARVMKRIRVRVTMPRDESAAARLPDRPDETTLVQRLLGPMRATARRDRMPEAFAGRGSPEPRLDEGPYDRYKLIVNETSIIRVHGETLQFSFVPIETIDPLTLHITNKGREIPIHFVGGGDGSFDPEDYFDFFGERNEGTMTDQDPFVYQDPFSQDNVYWMTWGDGQPGLRLGQEDGSWHPSWQAQEVRFVRTKLHFEKDQNFQRLQQSSSHLLNELQSGGPLAILQDHWFWGEWIDALSSKEFTVNLPFPDPQIEGAANPVILRAALHGFSWGTGLGGLISAHHRASISINGHTDRGLSVGRTFLGDDNQDWIGQTPVIIQSNPEDPENPGISTRELVHGTNTVRVDVPGDGLGGVHDRILVNWFEVEYDRDTRGRNGFIQFNFDEARGDTFAFDIRGFGVSDINVWKLGRGRLANVDRRLVSPVDESASWAARFQLISDDAYDILVWDERYVRPPFMIVADSSDMNLRTEVGARYLLIAHDSFIHDPALQRLDSMRRRTFNGSVLTIPLSEVYESFSHGLETPLAIHSFLKYAYEEWSVRPTHVCLVGDAVLQQRWNNRPGNLLPGLYMQTFRFGIAAADQMFGCVSGPPWDIIPDIAIGRISCRNSEDLEAYVSKVYQYEFQSDFEGPYHSRIMMIADENDTDFDFVSFFSESVIRLLPDDINIHRVYLDSIPPGQGFTRLRDGLRKGSVVVNYNGHGGGGLWSGSRLIDTEGVGQLTGQRTFPFVTNYTCYVGAFDDHNSAEVLGEVFLFERNAVNNDLVGATGFYSSSGVGWANAGLAMQKFLFDFAMERPGLTYGELAQLNKARYWAAQNSSILFTTPHAMMMMMNLLGDPGVRLTLPERGFDPMLAAESNVVTHGQTVQVAGNLPWVPGENQPTFLYALPYNGDIMSNIDWRGRTRSSFVQTTRSPVFDQDRVSALLIDDQAFVSDTFSISPRFVTPRGRVVVFATDPFEKRNAIGSFPIYLADSLESIQIFDVEPYPSSIIIQDSSFYVRATILHQDNVESVYMRGVFLPAQGPVVLDTMSMAELEPGVWTSTLLGPYGIRGGLYRVKFFVTPTGGEVFESPFYDIRIEGSVDFGLTGALGTEAGEWPGAMPYFYQPMTNQILSNSPPIPFLKLRLIAVSQDTVWGGFFPTITTNDSFSTEIVLENVHEFQYQTQTLLPARFRQMPYHVTVMVDPDDEIPENNERNNVQETVIEFPGIHPVTRNLGTYYPPTEYFPIEFGPHRYWDNGGLDTLWLLIPPGQLHTDSATLVYYPPRKPSSADLETLSRTGLYPIFDDRGPTTEPVVIFRVTLQDSSELLAPETQAFVELSQIGFDSVGASVPSGFFGLFERQAGIDYWRLVENSDVEVSVVDSAVVLIAIDTATHDTTWAFQVILEARGSGIAHDLGEFALFSLVDEQGPYVEIAIGGIRFTQNSIVPSRPELYVNLSDPLGVDRGTGKFFIILDVDTIPDWEISWSDTMEWGGATTALIRPELNPGDHVIGVYATDNAGNTSTLSADFTVRGDFGFEWAINYPNPFARSTTISYVLTGATDKSVEVKIYTVSGRLIRTLRDPERETANYRTQVWNGRDESGEEVANGVYFAKVIARRGDEMIEKMVKLAKLR